MKENKNLNLELSEEQMKDWVDHTFKEVDLDGNGLIDYSEYQQMIKKHPAILNFLNINIEFLNDLKEEEINELNEEQEELEDDQNITTNTPTRKKLSTVPNQNKIGMIYYNKGVEESKSKKSSKKKSAKAVPDESASAASNQQDDDEDQGCTFNNCLFDFTLNFSRKK